MSYDPYAPREAEAPSSEYSPVKHPLSVRDILRKLFAPIIALGLLLLKFGAFAIKFFGIFISVGGYALIWGWRFAVGFVLLILVHELGHYLEAKRQGLNPSLPVFIPFLGAYVAMKNAPFDPWRNLLVSAAGPFLGGLGAARRLGRRRGDRLAAARRARLHRLPAEPLQPDPGPAARRRVHVAVGEGAAARQPRAPAVGARPAGSAPASSSTPGSSSLLVLGMVATHVAQNRL